MKKIFFIQTIIALSIINLNAQQIVKGKILDDKNQPIEGVLVQIKGTNFNTNSNTDGTYDLFVPEGYKTLNFIKKGYKEIEAEISGETINISIKTDLKQKDVLEMNLSELMNLEVTTVSKVSQKVSDAPAIISVITANQIEQTGARTLSDALKMIAGIQILNRRNGYDMVWIRGVTTGWNTKVLLLIDGVPIKDAILGAWSPDEAISTVNIERIEIIQGPGASLYGGNAYAGIISVITKESTNKNIVSVTGGSFGTQQINFYGGKQLKKSKLIMSGNIYKTDGNKMDRDRKGKETEHTDKVYTTSIHAKYLYKKFRTAITHTDFTTNYPLYKTARLKEQNLFQTYGFADLELGNKKINFTPRLYFFRSKNRYDSKTTSKNGTLSALSEYEYLSTTIGFDGQFNWQIKENNMFVAGLQIENNDVPSYYEKKTLSYSKVDSVQHIIAPGDTIYVPVDLYDIKDAYVYSWLNIGVEPDSEPGQVAEIKFALFLQDEISFFNNKLNLTLGARLDKYTGFGIEFSPRVGLVYLPIKNLSIKALWGKAFKPPTFRQQFTVRLDGKSPGNPDLEPERIQTYETEVSYFITNNSLIKLSYFNNTLNNFIHSENYNAYSNNTKAKQISGIKADFNINYKLNTKLFKTISGFINYSYIDAIDKSGEETIIVQSIAKHSGNIGLMLSGKQLNFYTGLNYLGRRNPSETYHTGVKVEEYKEKDNKGAYQIIDMNIQYRFNKVPFKLNLSVHNLLNTEHYNPTYDSDKYYDFTKEGRNIALKLILEF